MQATEKRVFLGIQQADEKPGNGHCGLQDGHGDGLKAGGRERYPKSLARRTVAGNTKGAQTAMSPWKARWTD